MVPEENYAGRATAGLTTGTIGTVLGGIALLGNCARGGGLFGNLFGGGCGYNNGVNDVAMAAIAQKDARIAQLEAQQYADRNTIDLFRYQDGKNEAMIARIAQLEAQVGYANNVLGQITKVVVPNTSVCPGWGSVTITPATSTTTAAA